MGRHALRLGLLLLFLVLMVLVSRPFCRTFCPLGATYALLSRLALWRVRFTAEKCVDCGLCSRVCPTDLDVPKEAGGPECIACGDCIRACPKGAIDRKFGLAD
jgi:polyferredoxin